MHKLCQVPRELLKTAPAPTQGTSQMFPEGPGKCKCYENYVWSLLLHKFKQNAKQSQIFGHCFCFFTSSLDHGLQRGFYIEMHSACRNQQDNGDNVREVGSIHVAVWHYSSMAVQQYDSITLWQRDSTAVWQYSSIAEQQYDSTTVWQRDSTTVWQYSSTTEQQYDSKAHAVHTKKQIDGCGMR